MPFPLLFFRLALKHQERLQVRASRLVLPYFPACDGMLEATDLFRELGLRQTKSCPQCLDSLRRHEPFISNGIRRSKPFNFCFQFPTLAPPWRVRPARRWDLQRRRSVVCRRIIEGKVLKHPLDLRQCGVFLVELRARSRYARKRISGTFTPRSISRLQGWCQTSLIFFTGVLVLRAHLVGSQVRLVYHPAPDLRLDGSLDRERALLRLESLLADSGVDGLAGYAQLGAASGWSSAFLTSWCLISQLLSIGFRISTPCRFAPSASP